MLVLVTLLLLPLVSGKSAHPHQGAASRIIGGRFTEIEDHPYHVAILTFNNQFRCAGTIVTTTAVLTAAHPLKGWPVIGLNIRSGQTSLTSATPEGDMNPVQYYVIHPMWPGGGINNIAVVVPQNEFSVSLQRRPIPITKCTLPQAGSVFKVVGWGADYDGGPRNSLLKEENVTSVDYSFCQAQYIYLSPSMFCAGQVGHASCRDDVGGAATINGELYGIFTGGHQCGTEGTVGMYTLVNYPPVLAFIKTWTGL